MGAIDISMVVFLGIVLVGGLGGFFYLNEKED